MQNKPGVKRSNPVVIFLDYFENPDMALPIINKISAKLEYRPVVVTLNFDVGALNKHSGFEIVYFDDLLSREDYAFMDKYVFNLTQTWHEGLKPAEGINQYKQINFGALAEFKAQSLFSSAVKRLQITLKIIERFCPAKIILIGEADVFRGLSVFIMEELHTPSLFIEAREKDLFVGGVIKKIKQWITEIAVCVFDSVMRWVAVRTKTGRDGIFIDGRLYFELKGLITKFQIFPYLMERGALVRLRFIKDEKLPFAPILAERFLRSTNILNCLHLSLYRYWKDITRDVIFRDRFIYKDFKIWKVLQRPINELVICDFSQAKRNVVFLERLYKRLKPRLVILREAVRGPEKTIVFTARQALIQTLVIQHGILAGRHIYTKLHCDKIAVWGDAGIDYYSKYGNDASRCVVTGNIKHDLMYSRKGNLGPEAKGVLLKIGADISKQSILYLPAFFRALKHGSNVYFSVNIEHIVLDLILNILKGLHDKQLIVKIHPFDPVNIASLYNSKVRGRFSNVFMVKNADLLSLMESSSLVITSHFSSAALDAVILRKPLITLNFYKNEDIIPFAQRGVAVSVTKPENLLHAVNQVFEDKKLTDLPDSNRESFIYDYAYKIDGKSRERLMDLIRRLYEDVKSPETKGAAKRNVNPVLEKYKNECLVNKSSL
jgi:hypothetical protein